MTQYHFHLIQDEELCCGELEPYFAGFGSSPYCKLGYKYDYICVWVICLIYAILFIKNSYWRKNLT